MRLNSEKMLMGGVCFEPVTFAASDSLQQWKIPAGVRKIRVDCVAAAGATSASNYAGGKGGRVQCDLKVSSGQILYIMAGKKPSDGQLAVYNASDIRIGGTEYSNRVIVAGGGGSASYGNRGDTGGGAAGGNGGGLTGADGDNTVYTAGGKGGTQTAGGAGGKAPGSGYQNEAGKSGSLGLGGDGIKGPGNYANTYSGAGGAGYYGGGSGAAYEYFGTTMAAGGGGSSYAAPSLCSSVVHTQGYCAGNGYVTISTAK